MKLNFGIVEGSFSIHQLSPDSEIPDDVSQSSFYSISRTEEELSIVCPSSIPIISENSDAGWSCLKVIGPLDFSLTGILADIAVVLAKAGISIFAISTFNTDFILVKTGSLENAIKVLRMAEHTFID